MKKSKASVEDLSPRNHPDVILLLPCHPQKRWLIIFLFLRLIVRKARNLSSGYKLFPLIVRTVIDRCHISPDSRWRKSTASSVAISDQAICSIFISFVLFCSSLVWTNLTLPINAALLISAGDDQYTPLQTKKILSQRVTPNRGKIH